MNSDSGRLKSSISLNFLAGTVLLGATIATPAAAESVQLIYSTGWPAEHVQTGVMATEWIKRIEEATEGRVTFRQVHGGALLSGEATLDGVRRGVADCGALVTSYNPGALPITTSIMGSMDMELGNKLDIKGVTAIATRLSEEFEELRAEYTRIGVRDMLWAPTTPYAIISTKPVSTLADLDGQKLRGFGQVLPKFQTAMGAVPVSVAFGEMYTSMQTGLLDGAMTDIPAASSMQLYEIAKHLLITGPKDGTSLIGPSVVYICNENSLSRISPEDQAIMAEVGKGMFDYIAELMEGAAGDALQNLIDNGVSVSHLTEEDIQTLGAKLNLFDEAAQELDSKGLPGTAIAARYRELADQYVSGEWKP